MIPAPCILVYCKIPPPALVGHGILSILIFEYRETFLHMFPDLPTLSPMPGMLRSLQIHLKLMTSMKLLITNSCNSQTHSLGKVMATEVGLAFGPSCIYCSPGLLWAVVALVDSQNLHPWGSSFEKSHLGGQI